MSERMNLLAAEIHANAVAHGWWGEPRSFGEVVALCHSELSEALEEYRNGRPLFYYPCNDGSVCCEEEGDPFTKCGSRVFNPEEPETYCKAKSSKPEGIAVEMIDCIIRILDWCGKEGVDVDAILAAKHEYNITRPFRHGNKVL